jgi:hypothetical protein
MAIVTHFMVTSASGKRLALQDLETLAAHLVREGWVRFPAAILVGGVAYEPRYTDKETDGESSWEGFSNFSRWVAPHFIVPNDPTTMVYNLTQKRCAADLVWYDGSDEHAYRAALHRVPFQEQNVCLCFPNLDARLRAQRWEGAVIYALTRPALIDFVEPSGYDASRLIHRGVTLFLTLYSRFAGRFSDLANNPLRAVLERSFGPDLEMAQTLDNEKQWLRDAPDRGKNNNCN